MTYTKGQAVRDEIRDRIADLSVAPSPAWAAGVWETYRAQSVARIGELFALRHSQDNA